MNRYLTLVCALCLGTLVVHAQSNSNSVKETVITVPGVASPTDVTSLPPTSRIESTTYLDGLGRPIQKVQRQASPMGFDVVVPMEYDAFGRQSKSFLPYVAGSNNGQYQADAATAQPGYYSTNTSDLIPNDQRPYMETLFEHSPLNRPQRVFGAGDAWFSGNRATGYQYATNEDGTANGQERIVQWLINENGLPERSGLNGGYYTSNQLLINSVTDEEGHESREYIDKEGRVILKKIQYVDNASVSVGDQWAHTYYVYDVFGLLRYVFQPELSKELTANNPTADQLTQLAFQYTYDGRGRMVAKRVPGSGGIDMIYDSRDRVILTQDAGQRAGHQWFYTRYDALNRPVVTGIYTHPNVNSDREAISSLVANTPLAETFSLSNQPHGYSNNMFSGLSGTFSVLTVTYYDDYSWKQLIPSSANFSLTEYDYKQNVVEGQYEYATGSAYFPRVVGQLTGSKTLILDSQEFLISVNYFDDNYRVVQSFATNHKGGYDRITNKYDFVGKTLVTQADHLALGASASTRRRFFYDAMGRLEQVMFKIDDQPEILQSSQKYNELGQLVSKRLHATSDPAIGQQGTVYGNDIIELSQYNGEKIVVARTKVVLKPGFTLPGHSEFTARIGGEWEVDEPELNNDRFSQVVDYRYNIRGWLSRINDGELTPDDANDPKDYFGMNLYYENQNTALGNSAQFGGNISAIKWNNFLGESSVKEKGYLYDYDPLNRITASAFLERTTQWNSFSNLRFSETDFEYDMNGNIGKLKRNNEGNGDLMDDLQYAYVGNQLRNVQDAGDPLKGFIDGAGSDDEYEYDENGNMIRDLNKGITSDITYNHLNLPVNITRSQNSITYKYDAAGRKLSQLTNFNGHAKTIDYVSGYQYENDVLQSVATEEGRVMLVGRKLVYYDDFSSIETSTAVDVSLGNYPDAVSDPDYVKAISNGGSAGIHPIGGELPVTAGQRVNIRLKAYSVSALSTPSQAWLKVAINGVEQVAKALIPNGAHNEAWVEITLEMPGNASSLTVAAGWSSSSVGDELFLNEVEVNLLEERDPEYQYYLKDHLGNVRLTYTTRNEYDNSLATLETAEADRERSEFLRYDLIRKVKSALFDHTNDPTDGYAIRLNGSANERIGLSKTLSVMPGDEITTRVFAKYIDPQQSNPGAFVSAFLTQIASPPAGMIVDGPGYAGGGNVALGVTPIDHSDETEAGPMAYINYIFINKDYDLSSVRTLSKKVTTGAAETGTSANGNAHEELIISDIIREPGYVYIYLSNDNLAIAGQQLDVFFDDFDVRHDKSRVVEANDYYPFGLTFNSYLRESGRNNPNTYIGKEEQSQLGLNWIDFGSRLFDPVLGRWFVQDPKVDKWSEYSPYNYALNNVVNYYDLDGEDVYILYYTTGNHHGDNMFQAAADTRRRAIEEGEDFDPEKDKVIMIGIQDISDMQDLTNWAVETYKEQYGKTAEVGVWSHSGTDGPIGTAEAKKDFLEKGSRQMSLDGWGKIDYNWKDQDSKMAFYGCNSANEQASKNFAQEVSGLENYGNIEVSGQSTSSYPSFNTDVRATSVARNYDWIGAWNIGNTYMVGGNKGEGGLATMGLPYHPAANPMNVYRNRQKLRTDFQSGKRRN